MRVVCLFELPDGPRYEVTRFPEPSAESVEGERLTPKRARCIRGHRLDAGNVYIDPRGRASCRTCSKDSLRRSRGRK